MPQVMTSEVSSILKERLRSNAPQPKPKNNPASIVIVLAVLSLVIMGAARMFSAKPEVKNTVTIVGAGTDLAPGSRIHFSNLHYIEVPSKYVTAKMLVSNENVVGSVLKHYVPQGEPITTDDLFAGKDSLSSNLETHERAITLRLEPEALVDNELAPDDMVDVISTATKDSKHYTKTICQNARVVFCMPREAMESRSLRITDSHRVTIAVGPKEAELISHAAETAKIRLVLRSRLSRRVVALNGVGDDDILPAMAHEVARPAALEPVPLMSPPSLDMIGAPPPPVTPDASLNLPVNLPEPVKWVVEMFSGSRKELYAIPSSN